MNIHCGNVVANNKQYHYVCLVDGYNNSVMLCHGDRWFNGNIQCSAGLTLLSRNLYKTCSQRFFTIGWCHPSHLCKLLWSQECCASAC